MLSKTVASNSLTGMKQRPRLELFGLLGADHHFGDEVDDSTSRLLGVVLGEEVTHVPRAAPTLPRYEAKDPARTQIHAREKQKCVAVGLFI